MAAEEGAAPKHTNRLAQETSPYLLQHAHNPVDWYPWGEEAFAKARAEEKPILLSVGYSACHWCHVMEHESFEDEGIAALMNEHFVCVKVDREERPDVDGIYMQATLTLRGQGGWPMNVFLTPELEPFFAGTYFPKHERHGMPSWPTVCASLARAWADRRDDVVKDAARLTEHLRESASASAPGSVGVEGLAAAAAQLAEDFDPRYGGFGPAPKFPRCEALGLLLRHHQRSGDAHALAMVRATLEGMAKGGIYDHVGGGFSRYSTDSRWLVPHFEKMLYDNAQLAKVLLAAYQVTGDSFLRRVAVETLDYVQREMTSPEGGFYSATDADSEGVEGKFFVWTPAEIEDILGAEEGRRFCAYYDVTEGGNWEGHSILNTPRSVEEVAEELQISPDALKASLNAATETIYRVRDKRVHPGLDDKILTAWNGLMISALSEGFRVLGEGRYLEGARRAATFLLSTMVREDGGLLRAYGGGQARFDAYLEDYAYLADALIDLYEAGGERKHLAAAALLGERLLEDFAPEGGGAFFFTARGHERMIVRQREGHDGATPNPNAVAAMALARLSYHLDMPELRTAARKAVEAYGGAVGKMPHGFCQSLAVVDLLADGPVELALVGRPGEPSFDALWEELGRHHLPNRVIARLGDGEGDGDDLEPLPLLAGKTRVEGKAALYVCKNFACQAPVTDPARVAGALGRD